jgi:hypothetical protein
MAVSTATPSAAAGKPSPAKPAAQKPLPPQPPQQNHAPRQPAEPNGRAASAPDYCTADGSIDPFSDPHLRIVHEFRTEAADYSDSLQGLLRSELADTSELRFLLHKKLEAAVTRAQSVAEIEVLDSPLKRHNEISRHNVSMAKTIDQIRQRVADRPQP